MDTESAAACTPGASCEGSAGGTIVSGTPPMATEVSDVLSVIFGSVFATWPMTSALPLVPSSTTQTLLMYISPAWAPPLSGLMSLVSGLVPAEQAASTGRATRITAPASAARPRPERSGMRRPVRPVDVEVGLLLTVGQAPRGGCGRYSTRIHLATAYGPRLTATHRDAGLARRTGAAHRPRGPENRVLPWSERL